MDMSVTTGAGSFTALCGILGISETVRDAFVRSQFLTPSAAPYHRLDANLQQAVGGSPGEDTGVSFPGEKGGSEKSRRVVPYDLDVGYRSALELMFDEFDLEFKSYRTCTQPVVRTVGLLAREALYMLLRGRPFSVVEFTGAFHEAVLAGRPHTHVCAVCEHGFHYADMRTELVSLYSLYKSARLQVAESNIMYNNLRDFFEKPSEYMCSSPSKCRRDADVLMFDMLHSFTPLVQVASLAVARGAQRVLGFFIYSRKMEEETDFLIESLGISCHVDRANDKMYLYTEDGNVLSPLPYREYMNLARANSVRVGRHSFTYELFDKRADLFFFKMQAVGDCLMDRLEHAVWRNDYRTAMYRICSYRLKRRTDAIVGGEAFLDRTDAANYEPYVFYAPAGIVYSALLYALGLPRGKLSRQAIMKRLEALASRVVIDAVRVEMTSKLTADELNHLSYVLFVMAYQIRYDDAMVAKYMGKMQQMFDTLTCAGFWTVAATAVYHHFLGFHQDLDETFSDDVRGYILKNHERYPMRPVIEKVTLFDISDLALCYGCPSDYATVGFNPAISSRLLTDMLVQGKTFVQYLTGAIEVQLSRCGFNVPKLIQFWAATTDESVVDEPCISDVKEQYVQDLEESETVVLGELGQSLASKILEQNEFFSAGPSLMRTLPARFFGLEQELSAAVVKSSYPLGDLQETYAALLPGMDLRNTAYDAFDVAMGDLSLKLDTNYCRLTMCNKVPGQFPSTFEPKLVTGIAFDRDSNLVDAILGLQKRNFNVPMVEEPSHVLAMMNRVLGNFVRCFCLPDAYETLQFYKENPVQLTQEAVESWVSCLPAEKVRRLQDLEFCVDDFDIGCYRLMNRRKMKARAEVTAEYQAAQTVVYHDPEVNAYYSSIARQIMERLVALLRPNVLIFNRKSVADLDNFVKTYDPPFTRPYYLENDFSKFDKSQQERCLMLEWMLMKLLGIQDRDLLRWINGHIHSVALDYKNGIKMHTVNQRKSGDATTTLGNTIVNLLTVADIFGTSLKPENMLYAIFQGDDSIVALTEPVDTNHVTQEMALRFNLVSKSFITRYGSICSLMICKRELDGKAVVLRNPIKLTETLGRCRTDSEAVMFENHVSFVDVTMGYNDDINLKALENALQQRLGTVVPIMPMLQAIFTIRDSYDEFRSLFSEFPKTLTA